MTINTPDYRLKAVAYDTDTDITDLTFTDQPSDAAPLSEVFISAGIRRLFQTGTPA